MRHISWVALALAACGAPSSGGSSSSRLNPAFAGTWSGTTTFAFQGEAPQSGAGTLIISVAGRTATVSRVCLLGDGTITATGSGDSASWFGSLACAPVAFAGGCQNVAMTLTSGSVTISPTDLTAIGSGTAVGCGSTKSYTTSFTAAR